ncbi:hypothetical protein BDW66DRAFT_130594 [Aspergillus desertorum]
MCHVSQKNSPTVADTQIEKHFKAGSVRPLLHCQYPVAHTRTIITESRFSGQQLDDDLVESISCLLDAANVPNLLWGNYLLTVYGVPTIVDGASFVVPDSLTKISFSTLSEAGFLPCTRHLDCPHSSSAQCQPPYKHLHIDDELAISLYRKSDTLWEFPNFEAAFHDAGSDIMFASDV